MNCGMPIISSGLAEMSPSLHLKMFMKRYGDILLRSFLNKATEAAQYIAAIYPLSEKSR